MDDLLQIFPEELPYHDQGVLDLRLRHMLHLQDLCDDLHVSFLFRFVLKLEANSRGCWSELHLLSVFDI